MPEGIINWAQLLEQANEAGFGPEELYQPGPYTGVVVNSNAGNSQGGKGQVGLRIQFEGGVHDGKAVWANQTLTPDNPDAMGAWFRTFAALGIDNSVWATNPSLEEIANRCIGRRVRFTLKHREWPKGSGQKRNNVNITSAIEGGALATAPIPQQQVITPAAVAPIPPAAAPVPTPAPATPAAPAAGPAPAPAATPVAATAPAGVDPDQFAQFQAFLAQQQAAAPAAAPAAPEAAPAAEAAPLPERGF